MDKVFPEFEFDWLIDTIKRNLPKELDFVQEGQNCEHVSRLFTDTPFLKVRAFDFYMCLTKSILRDKIYQIRLMEFTK